MSEKKVKVRILAGRGIGGIGFAGEEVWMSQAEAQKWSSEGYVELADAPAAPAFVPEDEDEEDEEDHAVMKPAKRRR